MGTGPVLQTRGLSKSFGAIQALDSVDLEVHEGEVVAREFRGHDLTYRVRYHDRSLIAHTEYTHSFYPGQRVRLTAREPAVVLRDPNGRTASDRGGAHG